MHYYMEMYTKYPDYVVIGIFSSSLMNYEYIGCLFNIFRNTMAKGKIKKKQKIRYYQFLRNFCLRFSKILN